MRSASSPGSRVIPVDEVIDTNVRSTPRRPPVYDGRCKLKTGFGDEDVLWELGQPYAYHGALTPDVHTASYCFCLARSDQL